MTRHVLASVITLAAVLVTSNVSAKERWHNGPWGKSEMTCVMEGGDRWAFGEAYLSSWFNPTAKAKLTGGTKGYSRAQVRGRHAIGGVWGKGKWVKEEGKESIHDCGVLECWYAECRASVKY